MGSVRRHVPCNYNVLSVIQFDDAFGVISLTFPRSDASLIESQWASLFYI